MRIDLESYGLNPVFPEVIDSSMLKDFVDCPSLFYLRHVLGLRKKIYLPEEDSHLDWGTAWHLVVEIFRKTGNVSEALRVLNENWPASVNPKTDKHGRSKERMMKIFFDYVEKVIRRKEKEYEFLRGEQHFDVFDRETGFRWCGRMDEILRRRRNGKVVVWDYKTSSNMGKNYFDSHEHGFQLPGYVWAANRLFTEPVEEIALDVVYTLKASHDFFLRTFRYTQQKLFEWEENVFRIEAEIRRLGKYHLYEPEAWVKNWNNCTRYRLCQFSDVHFTSPVEDSRLRILSEDYIESRWDPRGLQENKEGE